MNRTGFFSPLLLAMVLLGGLWVPMASAQDLAAPQQVIRDASARLKTILRDASERLQEEPDYVYRVTDRVLMPHIDMQRVSALVLGRNWRKADVQQKQAFSGEFQRLLVRTYATAMQEFGNWEIRFPTLRARQGETRVLVKTQLLGSGDLPVAVDYSMYLKDGQWKVYDVKVEGISLVTNYRSNFDRLIRQKGIAGLIDELKAKNKSRVQKDTSQVTATSGRDVEQGSG